MKKKILIVILGLIACAVVLTACGKVETVAVTGVTLDVATASLTVGDTKQLTATVAPDNATDKSVTWTSSSAAVATVSGTGLVTAIGAGSANITVKTVDGEKTAMCAVTVKAAYVAVSGVTLAAVSDLYQGASATMAPTVSPANATNKAVTYTVSPTDAATVNAAGVVTVTTADIKAVTVTVTTDDGSKTANVTFNTKGAKPAGGIASVADFDDIFTSTAKLAGSYYLLNDVDFTGVETIRAVATAATNAFRGTFDGKGFALKNFTVVGADDSAWDIGIFGYIGATGVIRNTAFIDGTVTAIGRNGIIAGAVEGLIENCLVQDVSIEVTNAYYDAWCAGGGVVGDIKNVATAIVRNNVVKMTSSGAGETTCNYPLALCVRGPLAVIQNNFFVSDGISATTLVTEAEKPYANDSALVHSVTLAANNYLFAMSAIGTQNFSGLSGDFWSGNVASGATALPALKKI